MLNFIGLLILSSSAMAALGLVEFEEDLKIPKVGTLSLKFTKRNPLGVSFERA